jgi:hypothetical protein
MIISESYKPSPFMALKEELSLMAGEAPDMITTDQFVKPIGIMVITWCGFVDNSAVKGWNISAPSP